MLRILWAQRNNGTGCCQRERKYESRNKNSTFRNDIHEVMVGVMKYEIGNLSKKEQWLRKRSLSTKMRFRKYLNNIEWKLWKNEQHISELQDNVKNSNNNVSISKVPEEQEGVIDEESLVK